MVIPQHVLQENTFVSPGSVACRNEIFCKGNWGMKAANRRMTGNTRRERPREASKPYPIMYK
eukprot:EC722209.1.p2 GENE.EC722209.1~~EC722209.1.p2  ORF type:complete len:62 (-),score=1.48 EC722209.1:270-455(-)